MKAVIVTGSRLWKDADAVYQALDRSDPDIVIHGACPSGADEYADRCFDTVSLIPMPAQWDRDGKSAGPKRNQQMLNVLLSLRDCGYTVEVLAFPLGESRGTRGMMLMAEAAGVAVTNYGDRP